MPWINHGYGRPCGLWKFFFHLPNPAKICQSAFCATLIYQGWSRKSNRDASQHLRGNIERAMARHSAPCTRHHLGISYEIAGPFYVDIYIYIVFYILSCHTTCVVRHNFNFISISYQYNRLTTHEGSQDASGASRCWCTWILRQHIDKLCMILPDGTYASAEMDGKTMTEVSGQKTDQWSEDHDWRPLYIIKWLHLIFTLTIGHIICIDLRFGCRCSYSI